MMNKPSTPMLYEFELINDAKAQSDAELSELADKICELFTEDVVLEDTSTDDRVKGSQQLHAYVMGLFGPYSNVRIEPTEVIDSAENKVSTMLIEISGDHTGDLYGYPATGRRVKFPAVAIYRCNDDCTKVRHETLAYDTGYIIEQIKN
ncbi:ester cyclase [Mycolicibacterium obuense]|uniref:SnoaL-like polyketide cyclase n=1 Tax=Mycolicibacterium obuense TaxID=1807 RepID=A0A0J6Y901_9MYCO|nr:ester cyclase [Mycolicibacterium obuense]KMO69456.1 SnoaL-like polyketide cyclase [Mycolicibacterium obuense]